MKIIKKMIKPLLFILGSSLAIGAALFFFIAAPKSDGELDRETAPSPGQELAGGAAGETPACKNETVYVVLDPDGKVVDQRIVNRIYQCENKKAQKIKDHGDYQAINNMTSEAAPAVKDEVVLWDSSLLQEGDIYYEGIIDKELPVDFEIEYYLEGKKVKAATLPGKSGALQIVIRIKNKLLAENTVAYRSYHGESVRKEDPNYVPLLVQGTYTADLNRFSEIRATDGAGVITGQSMNISFMAFPYPETEIVLSMVGEDIELSQIMMVILPQLPPIPEVDLEDDLTEMLEGIIAMEEGLNELYEGADQIYQGLDQFRSKSNEMLARMKPMIALIEKLPLYEKQIPKAGEIRTHIEELRDYLDNLPDDWPERPDQWPDEWPDDWPERPDEWPDDWPDDWPDEWPDDWPDDWPELPDGLAEEISSYLKTAAEFLEELENLESYLSEAESTLSQLSALPEALDQLAGGQKAVRDGIEEVNRRGISEMKKGLIEGVNESRFGKAKIDLMESLADGYRSHADNENNRESSVQFILQTENAKQNNQETPGAGEKEDQPGDKGKTWYARLWSRFLDLFPQYANK